MGSSDQNVKNGRSDFNWENINSKRRLGFLNSRLENTVCQKVNFVGKRIK